MKLAGRYTCGPAVALMGAKQAIQHGIQVDMATACPSNARPSPRSSDRRPTIGMESFFENGPGKAEFKGR